MVYKIFWFWANIAIRVFYGKIEVNGLDNIPKDGPLLIASNHPNGFLEPIIMACLFPRDLHFMVRGDVFRKKWLNPILVNTNQIPIFRAKDGFADLRKNDANLKEAYKALDNDAAIILFIEGGTKSVKTLRPFQKGLARMASSYLSQSPDKQLNVLPVAINFISPKTLRSRVVLNIGTSFEANGYFQNEETKVQDIKKLTDDLYKCVSPLAFNVSDKNRQSSLNKVLRLIEGLFSLPFLPMVSSKEKLWSSVKSTSDRINVMNSQEFDAFQQDLSALKDIDAYKVQRTGKSFWIALFWTIITLLPGVIGLVLNIIPGFFAKRLAKKVLDEDNKVFHASIVLCSGVAFYVFYYTLMPLFLAFIFGWKALLFLLSWPLGFLYLFWKNNYRSSIARNSYHLSEETKSELRLLCKKHKITLQNTAK